MRFWVAFDGRWGTIGPHHETHHYNSFLVAGGVCLGG